MPLLLILFFISCNTQPEPIVAGKDVCSFCKMPVADTKFGAEIITVKGKLYKFDDLICMLNFKAEQAGRNEKNKIELVVDYTGNHPLINAAESFYLLSKQFHTPMNSGVVCFNSLKTAESFLPNFPGEVYSWNELQQKLK